MITVLRYDGIYRNLGNDSVGGYREPGCDSGGIPGRVSVGG